MSHIFALLEQAQLLDRSALEATETLRWAPFTGVFVLASTVWVKGPLFVAAATVGDLRSRRSFPVTGLLAGISVLLGSASAAILKQAFERDRPALADPGVDPLVATPNSPSFPSGHAATAFAAAALVAGAAMATLLLGRRGR